MLDYLCVDRFLRTIAGAQALKCAFESGIVDTLSGRSGATIDELADTHDLDRQGLSILRELLVAEGVIEDRERVLRLTNEFVRALKYRDLLEAKIEFANLVAPDLIDHFNLLINDPQRFMEQARVFSLFDYQRCFDRNPTNYALTERWVRFTTALTKYESAACAHHHDFSNHQAMLDIGGNSGEFARQLCKRVPHLRATVFDLPLVCDVGVKHLSGEPEADRVRFLRGDALQDTLPTGFDLVTFKSMLHDWPQDLASRLLERAVQCLAPGGTILIFERGPIRLEDRPAGYSLIPMVLFARSFRGPIDYQRKLERLGLRDPRIHEMVLDTPFFLLTARKAE